MSNSVISPPQILIGLHFFLSCSLVSATEFVRPKPLMEYADILLAQELEASMSALNDQMMHCVDAGGGSHSECFCRSQGKADLAKASYKKVIEARPKWKGKILYWKDTGNLASHNLLMPAIDHQLNSAAPECKSARR